MAVGAQALLSSSAELEVGGLKAASGHAFQRRRRAATTSFPSKGVGAPPVFHVKLSGPATCPFILPLSIFPGPSHAKRSCHLEGSLEAEGFRSRWAA